MFNHTQRADVLTAQRGMLFASICNLRTWNLRHPHVQIYQCAVESKTQNHGSMHTSLHLFQPHHSIYISPLLHLLYPYHSIHFSLITPFIWAPSLHSFGPHHSIHLGLITTTITPSIGAPSLHPLGPHHSTHLGLITPFICALSLHPLGLITPSI